MNLLIKALLIVGIFTFGSYGTYKTINMHALTVADQQNNNLSGDASEDQSSKTSTPNAVATQTISQHSGGEQQKEKSAEKPTTQSIEQQPNIVQTSDTSDPKTSQAVESNGISTLSSDGHTVKQNVESEQSQSDTEESSESTPNSAISSVSESNPTPKDQQALDNNIQS